MPLTPFPELDEVLSALTSGVRDVLGANAVGVYLVGSFAQGDGDAFSDCDFVVAVHDDLDTGDVAALDAMHAALHARAEEWAQHLEGSYFPLTVLRRFEDAPREAPGESRSADWVDPAVESGRATAYPLWYLNNGANTLVRSQHDNTRVTRWMLRHQGVALWGPPGRDLVDAIDPEALRAEVRGVMASFGTGLLNGSISLEPLWLQAFTAVFFCRTLQSLETAAIPSKPSAVRWAASSIDRRWLPVVERAWSYRARQIRGRGAPDLNRALPAAPEDIEETLGFVRYALSRAGIAVSA